VVGLNRFVQGLHAEARPDFFRPPDDMPGVIEHYERLCARTPPVVFLAEVDGGAVGYVVIEVQRRPGNPFTYAFERVLVDQISVHPELRRKGVGRALMGRVFREAVDLGIDVVALDTWDFNVAAQRFFESLGFSAYNLRFAKRGGPR